MHIACPKCAVGFDFPDAILGAKGRRLKCASCGQNWFQAAGGQQTLLDAQAEPEKKPAPGSTAQSIMGKQPQPGNVKAAVVDGHLRDQAGAHAVGGSQHSLMRNQPKTASKPGYSYMQPAQDQPAAGASGKAVSQRPGNAPAGKPGHSIRDQGAIAASNQVARSLAGLGEQRVEVRPPQSIREHGPIAGAPGQAAVVHSPGKVAAPGQAAHSLTGETARSEAKTAHSIREQGPIAAPGADAVRHTPEKLASSGQAAHSLTGETPRTEAKTAQSVREQGPIAGAPGQAAVTHTPEKIIAPGDKAHALTAEAPGAPGKPGQSVREQGPIKAPGAEAVSQRGEKIAAPGEAAHSLTTEPARTPAKPGESMRAQGPIAGPGGAPVQQPGVKVASTGEAPRTLVYDNGRKPVEAPRTMVYNADKPGKDGTSVRDQGPLAGPNAGAVSQKGAKIASPGDKSHSLLDDAAGKGADGKSIRDDSIAHPGAKTASQLGNEIAAPGEDSRSLLGGDKAKGADGASVRDDGPIDAPGAPAVSQLTGEVVKPPQDGKTLLDDGARGGKSGKSVHDDKLAAGPGAPAVSQLTGKVFKADTSTPRAPAEAPAQTLAAGAARAPAEEMPAASDEAAAPEEAAASASGGPQRAEAAAEPAMDDGVQPEPALATEPASPAPANKALPKKRKQKSKTKYYVIGGLGVGVAASLAVFFLLARHGSNNGPNVTLEALKIAESSQQVLRLDGVETLVVSGYVSNIGEVATALPNLRLELYNEKHDVLKIGTTLACAPTLSPKGSCRFSIKIASPDLDSAKGGHAIVWDK